MTLCMLFVKWRISFWETGNRMLIYSADIHKRRKRKLILKLQLKGICVCVVFMFADCLFTVYFNDTTLISSKQSTYRRHFARCSENTWSGSVGRVWNRRKSRCSSKTVFFRRIVAARSTYRASFLARTWKVYILLRIRRITQRSCSWFAHNEPRK